MIAMPKYFCISLIVGVCAAFCSNSAQADERLFDAWRWPMGIDNSAKKEVVDQLEMFRQDIGNRSLLVRDRNPVCCLWFQVTNWKPNPGEDGYIIVIQQGGGLVMASDDAQVGEALARLRKLMVIKDGKRYLPVGLFTNYKTPSEEKVKK
jgi:hypothetical protein